MIELADDIDISVAEPARGPQITAEILISVFLLNEKVPFSSQCSLLSDYELVSLYPLVIDEKRMFRYTVGE